MIDECIINPIQWNFVQLLFAHYTIRVKLIYCIGIYMPICTEIYMQSLGLGTTFIYHEAHTYQNRSTRILWYTDLCRTVWGENRKSWEIRLFGLARSSNYPVYSIYITYTNAYPCPTPKPPLNVATLTPTASRQPK